MNDSRSRVANDGAAAPVEAIDARDARIGDLGPQRKREEWRTWMFLSLIMAPILAVLIVSGYGFVVWMYQIFVGPPGT